MTDAIAVQTTTAKAAPSNSSSLLVQRKCACGGSAGLTGECTDCQKKKLVGKPLQTKLRVNEPGDEYEQEADRVAEQVMRMADSAMADEKLGSRPIPLVQREIVQGNTGVEKVPSIVDQVLSTPGQPLDENTRAFFEPRFGHGFGRVRVHTGAKAAESAWSIDARAYTVGQNIVLGAVESAEHTETVRRLLAHELTHVLQQGGLAAGQSYSQSGETRISGDPQARSSTGPRPRNQEQAQTQPLSVHECVQRSGLEFPSTTEGRIAFGSSPTPGLAAGLAEPDCSTRVSDVFQLGAVYCPQRPECCFAQIHDRKDPERNGIFRADYLIEGKPECEYGDQKSHDYWLHMGNDQWRIVEIDSTTRVTVMNNCGEEEVLGIQEGGATKQSAPLPDTGDARVLKPSDENSQGSLKKTHEIRWDINCDRVTLKPIDNSKPSSVYIWDSSIDEFVNEKDKSITKTPGQLESLAGITTKVREDGKWQSTRCGDLPRIGF